MMAAEPQNIPEVQRELDKTLADVRASVASLRVSQQSSASPSTDLPSHDPRSRPVRHGCCGPEHSGNTGFEHSEHMPLLHLLP